MKKTYIISFLLLDENDLAIKKEETVRAYSEKQAISFLKAVRYPRRFGYLVRDVKVTEKKEEYEQLTLF